MKKPQNYKLVVMLNVLFSVVIVSNIMPPLFENENPWATSESVSANADILIEENFATNIIPTNEEGYDHQNEQYDLKVYFRREYSPGSANLLKVTRNEHWLTWQPMNMAISDGAQALSVGSGSISAPTRSFGIIEDNRIEYPGLYEDSQSAKPLVNDEYIVLNNELKHNIILNERPLIPSGLKFAGKTTLDFVGVLEYPDTLRLFCDSQERLKDFTTASSLELRDNNNPILLLPAPYAYEMNDPTQTIKCQYSIEFQPLEHPTTQDVGSGISVKLGVKTPNEWLDAPARKYPIVIDPTITLPKSGAEGIDTFIQRGDHTTLPVDYNNSNFGKDPILRITNDNSNTVFICRILLYFDVSNIDPIAEIQSAILKLKLTGQDDQLLTIGAYRITKAWVEGTGRISNTGYDGACWNTSDGVPTHLWSPGGDRDIKEYATTEVSTIGPWYTWDLTELVQEWVDEKYDNDGVMLVGTDGQDVVKEFSSSEGTVSYYPKLDITYNTPPSLNPEFEGYIHKKNEDTPIHYLDLNKLFHDPDNDDSLDFQIHTGTSWDLYGPFEGEFVDITIENNDSLKFELKPNKFGTETVKLKAFDESDSTKQHQLTIKIKSVNDAPQIFKVDDEQLGTGYIDIMAQEGHAKNITIETQDKDFTFEGDALTYEYSANKEYTLAFGQRWDRDLKNGTEMTSLIFRPSNSDVGEAYINITVSDQAGENHTVKIRVTVTNKNNPPINPDIKCFKDGKPCTDFTTAETVRLEGSADDPDFYIPDPIEKLSYEWRSDIQGEVGSTQILETKLKKGEHVMTLKVTDSEGDFIKTSIPISIKNQPTIDNANASNDHVDVAGDVISYSHEQYKDEEGTTNFKVEKGKYEDLDIIALGTDRDENDLIIYLTVDGVISNASEYEYQIFLVIPNHMESQHEIRDKYSKLTYNEFYHPDPKFEFYAKFTFADGQISEDDPSTIIIIKDLGDLEAGEGIKKDLEVGFDIFAIAKYNLHDPSGDPLKHYYAYDSAGHGSVAAPSLTTKEDPPDIVEDLGENYIWLIIAIAAIIVIIVALIVLKRRRDSDDSKKDDGVIYDTSNLEVLAPGARAHQAPPPSTGAMPPPAQQLQQIAPPPPPQGGPGEQVPPPRAPVPLTQQPQQMPVQQMPGQVPTQQQRQQLKRY